MFTISRIGYRLLSIPITLVIASGGILTTFGVASADDHYNLRVVNTQSDLCLNLAQWDTSNEATIIQWPCDYTQRRNNERWDLIQPSPDPTGRIYFIKNEHSHKCIDITATADGGYRATQQDCVNDNTGRQLWHRGPTDGDGYTHVNGWTYSTFENLYSHQCLEVPQGDNNKGTVVRLGDCNGSSSQIWKTRQGRF